MTLLRVLIVDDEAPARLRLRQLLEDISSEIQTRIVSEAKDGLEALQLIHDETFDVALIDVRMPRLDGLQLALQLASISHAPKIVFTTAYDQHAIQAFDLNATDYLLKPVRAERLVIALQKVVNQPSGLLTAAQIAPLAPAGRAHLRSSVGGKVMLVPVVDIIFLRAELKYVSAYSRTHEYLIDESLVQLELEFSHLFIRAHRNCLVARNAISGYERIAVPDAGRELQWVLLLQNSSEKIPVSRRQWPHIKALLKG
ncbi:MAG TPA: LytTR family DNA-binding domain-containing protein [Rhodocyclaceae bacterium]|jgi:two-component system response regulator AlgR